MRRAFALLLILLAFSAVATHCAKFIEHAKTQRAEQISQVAG